MKSRRRTSTACPDPWRGPNRDIRHGDRNFRFYQLSMVIWRKRNTTNEIKLLLGQFLKNLEQIGKYFVRDLNFFLVVINQFSQIILMI